MAWTLYFTLFVGSNALSSAVYFYLLDWCIATQSGSMIAVLSAAYALVWFVTGMTLGRRDAQRSRVYLGLRYHTAVTCITIIAIAGAALFLRHITWRDVVWVSGAMSVALAGHYAVVRLRR